MQPVCYISMKKSLILSLTIIVFIGAVASQPAKPLQSHGVKVDFSAKKLVVMRTIKLFRRNGKFLEIDTNGMVSGTSNCSLPTVSMEMISVGLAGVKMIKGVASGRYLAMDKYGSIYSTTNAVEEALFFVTTNNGCSTFASFNFYRRVIYDTVVGMKNNGKMRSGAVTNTQKNTFEFLDVPLNLKCSSS